MRGYVLNPALTRAVDLEFGGVRVLDAGQPLEGYYEPEVDPRTGETRVRLRIVRRGETLMADCPFCGDRRGRLAINHRYGVRDAQTGFRGTELWKCYNEECQGKAENRRTLWDRLSARMVWSGGPRLRDPAVAVVEKGRLPPCEFPGLLVSLTDLPPDHKAVRYVRSRGFDPAELAAVWKVGYAESVPARVRGSGAQDRLVCPVHLDGVMVGYQARFIGELDWKAERVPKYLTFFPKSQTLYGIDEAKDAQTLVLVEGVTDVWRYGPGAVSPLGKSLSVDQARLLASHLDGRTLIVAPDADDPKALSAFAENAALVARQDPAVRTGIVAIPPGKDPAAVSRACLRARVEFAAAAATPFFSPQE